MPGRHIGHPLFTLVAVMIIPPGVVQHRFRILPAATATESVTTHSMPDEPISAIAACIQAFKVPFIRIANITVIA